MDYQIKQRATLIRKRPSQLFKILLLQVYSPGGKFNVLTECSEVHCETISCFLTPTHNFHR